MKRAFSAIALLLSAALVYQSCDYVRSAVPAPGASATTTGTPGLTYRKVLIEDYTGHKCGNCPGAARKLREIDSLNPGKIIPLAVHAGFYAAVNTTYPDDLRSQAGTDWDNTFVISNGPGNPNGLVNRVGYGTASFIQTSALWATSAASMDTMLADFKLEIANTFDAGTKKLTTQVTTTALKYKSGLYKLIVVISEDSIVGPQLDYSLNTTQYPNQIYPNYVFNHVLRGAINSTWGDTAFSGTINVNDVKVSTYASFQLAAGWDAKHCHVVAFIYDADPASARRYEIVQAEEKEVE
jgi:hypothetical protein